MDIENDPEIPNVVRSIIREATEIGSHAEAEAFATFLRIIDATDGPVKPLAMLIGAVKMSLTVDAVRTAIVNQYPELERLATIGFDMARKAADDGAREFRPNA